MWNQSTGERFKLLWPASQNHKSHRIRRSSGSHGGLDFPASETALMTISFLTLAVFLIKLVLVRMVFDLKSKYLLIKLETTIN